MEVTTAAVVEPGAGGPSGGEIDDDDDDGDEDGDEARFRSTGRVQMPLEAGGGGVEDGGSSASGVRVVRYSIVRTRLINSGYCS